MVQSIRAGLGMLRLPWLNDAPIVTDSAAPHISIIFAARDAADALPAALATLLDQDYPRYEVIAVNDRSTDATGEILSEAAKRRNRLKAVNVAKLPEGWLGKPHALWLGAQQA